MWWNQPNFDKPRPDATGQLWHIRVWSDTINGVAIQRVYFWNARRTEMGVAVFQGDQVLHVRQLKQRIDKIVHDQAYRQRFRCDLRFPIERYYAFEAEER